MGISFASQDLARVLHHQSYSSVNLVFFFFPNFQTQFLVLLFCHKNQLIVVNITTSVVGAIELLDFASFTLKSTDFSASSSHQNFGGSPSMSMTSLLLAQQPLGFGPFQTHNSQQSINVDK